MSPIYRQVPNVHVINKHAYGSCRQSEGAVRAGAAAAKQQQQSPQASKKRCKPKTLHLDLSTILSLTERTHAAHRIHSHFIC